tara:strand:+ start:253 stop:693 length:441 start_codon:yes stop_codon:yes gene_type:complete
MWGVFINAAGRAITHLLTSPTGKRIASDKGYKLLEKRPTGKGAASAVKQYNLKRTKEFKAAQAANKAATKPSRKGSVEVKKSPTQKSEEAAKFFSGQKGTISKEKIAKRVTKSPTTSSSIQGMRLPRKGETTRRAKGGTVKRKKKA